MIRIWSFTIILKDHLIEATNPQVWTLESWFGNTEGEIGVLFGLIQLPQQDDGRRKSLIRSAFLLCFFFKILIFWFHLPASADIGSPLVPRSPSRLLFPILAVAFMSLFAAAYAAGVKYMPAVLAPWQPKVLGLGPKGWRQWWLNINRYILYIDIFMPQ